jgi:1,4-dihydroxy-2-naphthoate octaprenyltransferase
MRWVTAMRLRTLPAAATPVVVGSALAYARGGFAFRPALAALIGALLLQIGANFSNDLFDFQKGADGADRLGPTRAVAAGLVTPNEMKVATAIVFLLATLVGAYLVARSGWPIVAIGVASILAALAYTGGPYPLGYHGLGEVFVFVFFGLVAVGGTYFVEAGTLDRRVLCDAIPVGLLSSAIIIVNNLRDRVSDERVGKRTLAVRLGRDGTIGEYRLLVLGAYVVALGLAVFEHQPLVALPLVSLPLALRTISKVASTDGAALNPLLGATARLLLVFGVLQAAGAALGVYVALGAA